jgi:hypothetical protein
MYSKTGLWIVVMVLGASGCATVRRAPEPPADRTSQSLRSFNLEDSLTTILRAGIRDSAFPGAVTVVGTKEGAVITVSVGQLDWQPSPAPSVSTLWTWLRSPGHRTDERDDAPRGVPVIDLDAPWNAMSRNSAVAGRRRSPFDACLHTRAACRRGDRCTRRPTAPPLAWLWRSQRRWTRCLACGWSTATLGSSSWAKWSVVSPDSRWSHSCRNVCSVHSACMRRCIDLQTHCGTALRRPRSIRGASASCAVKSTMRTRSPWGVSGHAGLFSSAHDLVRLARMYLNGGMLDGVRFVSPSTIAQFTAVQDSALSHRSWAGKRLTGQTRPDT